MKNYIGIIFKVLWSVALMATLLGAVLIIITIIEIPEEKIQKYKTPVISEQENLSFEQGSIVRKRNLEHFYNFTVEKLSIESWYESNQDGLEFLDSGDIVFKKDITLRPLAENNCSLLYCYQKRINFENIPGVFWKGLIGIEDYRFLDHHGIDPKSILRAIVTDIKAMKMVQGGSTLTQQLVKNLFYSNEKKLSRKLKEIVVAIYIESKYSKENILESYFNEVFWGSLNGIKIKGVSAASLFYFDKTPQEIKPYEAAILISLLKGPNFYHPIRQTDRLKKRANVVFSKLQNLKLFSTIGTPLWSDKQWDNWIKNLKNKKIAFGNRALWRTSKTEKNVPFNSFEIYTLNYEIEKLKSSIKDRVQKKDIGIKMLITDIETNKSLSYYSKYERDKVKAIENEYHQVGSTLKPIAYSIFNKFDYKLDDKVSTLPLTLNLKSGKWKPREAHKIADSEVTLKESLLLSYNRPVIRISDEIGFEKIEEEFLKFVPKLKKPLSEYPSQLLGAVELSVKELWSAYSQFIEKECLSINDSNKKWEDTILYQMSDPETTTVRRLVGKQMGMQRFFGKTGTSNNGLDNWYVFFDGKYLGVIWVGLEGGRSGESLGLYGGTTSFRLYNSFMRNRGKRFSELSCDNLHKKSSE